MIHDRPRATGDCRFKAKACHHRRCQSHILSPKEEVNIVLASLPGIVYEERPLREPLQNREGNSALFQSLGDLDIDLFEPSPALEILSQLLLNFRADGQRQVFTASEIERDR